MSDSDPTTPTPLLRQLRQTRGLTLREVSRRSDINPGRLSIIERGVPPRPDELARILSALEGPKEAA
jgi:transcriptional regulator with XRE-family HTH domain